MEQIAKELHRGIRRSFPRRMVYSPRANWIWSCDLIDYRLLKRSNDGFAYILICCDVFSKYVHAIPLENKDADTMLKAWKSFTTLPRFIWVDKGKEFWNEKMKAFCQRHGITMYSTFSESKSVIAERFARTLKGWLQLYMTMKQKNRWIDALQECVDQYNDRVHSTTKVKPIDALLPKYHDVVFYNMYTRRGYDPMSSQLPENALKVGDVVRISKDKGLFEKGYDFNWSEEMFKIGKVHMTNPITYSLVDFKDRPITGSFYRQELVKTRAEFEGYKRIEKELKVDNKNKRSFVKWFGWPRSFNSWVKWEDIEDF